MGKLFLFTLLTLLSFASLGVSSIGTIRVGNEYCSAHRLSPSIIISLAHCIPRDETGYNLNIVKFSANPKFVENDPDLINVSKIWSYSKRANDKESCNKIKGKNFNGKCDLVLLKIEGENDGNEVTRDLAQYDPNLDKDFVFRGFVKISEDSKVEQRIKNFGKAKSWNDFISDTGILTYLKDFDSGGSGGAILQDGNLIGMHKATLNEETKEGHDGIGVLFDSIILKEIELGIDFLSNFNT